ncbi:MAG: RDD family protein [Actinomycetota bacterium]
MPPGPPDDDFPRTPPLPPPPPSPSAYGPPPSAYPPAGPTGGRGPGREAVDSFGRPLASWGQRLGALVIDELFIFVVTFCAVFALGVRRSFTGAMVSLVMAAVYYAVLNGSEMGQTFGKRVMGIQVRDASGSGGTIGLQRAGLRYVTVGLFRVVPFFGLFTLLDGLWPLWDRHRQALHDKIAGSVVVRVSQS